MEKNSAVKLSAFSFLHKTKLFLTDAAAPTLLPQMPIEQILYYLEQAYLKSKPIIIQTTDRKNASAFHEYTGKLMTSPKDNGKIILSSLDKKTISMIKIDEIRYIQLTTQTLK
ncbi:hypothetical protein JTF06_01890 [Desemzia sp. RIT804]|uniref:hypothetical protein n=1 Tax=Desemzia sp. RIT 804 TaxID=2810209 RepID=UPI0019502D0D|nr:hypothetical protein [Desemzia sp. RIT 804]MBM6613642.1 hypothetical protein [Desemzia sp. RIT 804]